MVSTGPTGLQESAIAGGFPGMSATATATNRYSLDARFARNRIEGATA